MSSDQPRDTGPTASSSPAAETVLDGRWFRREREYVAIGRPVVAARLGVPLGRIVLVEKRNLPIPESWLPQVETLGFRLPEGWRSAETPAAAEPTPAAVSAQRPSSLPPTDSVPPLPDLPRGQWLRDRRYALNLLLPGTSKALQVSIATLRTIEVHNLVVPVSWLPTLRALKFYEGLDTEVRQRATEMDGGWLQRQRQSLNLSVKVLSTHLGVRESLLRCLEAGRWPVPPEWLARLQKLKFAAQQNSPDHTSKVISEGRTASPSPSSPTSRSAAQTPRATISGAWLRRHRERLGLMQKTVGERLRIKQATLCRYELKDKPVPSRWLPILKKLRFPVPLIEEPRQKREASLEAREPTQAAKQDLRKQTVTAATPAGVVVNSSRLDGAWLRREREHRGLSRGTMARQLGKKSDTIRRKENTAAPVPKTWLETLSQLGFRSPLPAKSTTGEQSPKTDAPNHQTPSPAVISPTPTGQQNAQTAPGSTPPLTGSPAEEQRTAEESRAMVQKIISYRLTLGRFARQSAATVLAGIADDLRQAQLEQAITHYELVAALTPLTLSRS